MKTLRKLFALCAFAPLLLASTLAAQVEEGTYHYGVEISGGLCGYAEIVVSTAEEDGEEYQLIEQRIFVMLSALGNEFNTTIDMTYHVDPLTGEYTRTDIQALQGELEFSFSAVIEGDQALCTSSLRGEEPVVVPLPEGVVLENPLYMPKGGRDFLESGEQKTTFSVLDVQAAEVQEMTATRAGEEKLQLAGKAYDTVVLDAINHSTGAKIRSWVDVETGMAVQVLPPNDRFIYLANPSIKKRIELVNVDSTILTKTNVSISNIPAIAYMKVKAEIEPIGAWLTPADLNVPGQRFEGTVKENLIEGIFEIEHVHYDGADAPPYPTEYSSDEALKEYLEPAEFIESDDPVLVKKARKLAEGSGDSWEAAVRLSRWVAENIGYEIPGGGTARKTYDMRVGECGAHSILLAAFCRAVEIPARVVWGCMYSPNQGGCFGQHAWTEIYMGAAGWIPVDSTAHETDFVDSGHIRLGELRAVSISFNAKSMEVLDYRLDTGRKDDEAAAIDYTPYLGEYDSPGGGDPFEVLVQDDRLALDIPEKMVLPFDDPDEEGIWYCTMSRNLFLEFPQKDDGGISELVLHELVRIRRKSDPKEIGADVPAEVRSYLGGYYLAQLKAEFDVIWDDEKLAFRHPLKGVVIHMGPPDEEGWRDGEFGSYRISFDLDDDGRPAAMVLDAMTRFPRR